eukprot:Selendium_serpulae@DN2185_c0_g1_i1.p1
MEALCKRTNDAGFMACMLTRQSVFFNSIAVSRLQSCVVSAKNVFPGRALHSSEESGPANTLLCNLESHQPSLKQGDDVISKETIQTLLADITNIEDSTKYDTVPMESSASKSEVEHHVRRKIISLTGSFLAVSS